MANEKPPAAAPPAADAAPAKKGGMKMIIMAAAVLALEGATVGVTVYMAKGPKAAIAKEAAPAPKETVEKDAEVKVLDVRRLPNNQTGKLVSYDLQIVLKVAEKNKTKVTDLLAEREAEIRDQVRTIIASSDPQSMAEPGLETLKRQLSHQIELDIGKELIKEVLIPTLIPNSY